MFFYILDLKEILKEYEDEIDELNKYLHDEINWQATPINSFSLNCRHDVLWPIFQQL